ncbi:MAG: O-antigen ligase family protein [Desulfobacterales bacterium]
MGDFLIIVLTLGGNLIGLLLFGLIAPLFLAVLLLPFSDTHLIPRQMFGITGINPFNITISVCLVAFFLRWLKDPLSSRLPRIPAIFGVYLFMLILGACAGLFFIDRIPPIPNPGGEIARMSAGKYLIEQFFKPTLILVVAFFSGVVVLNERRENTIFWAMALALTLLSLVILSYIALQGIDLRLLADYRSREFLSWIGMHANELGLMLNIGIALLFFSAARTSSMAKRLLLSAPVALGGISSLFTFSRAAFLGLAVILAYYLVSRRRFREIAVGIGLLAAIAWMLPKEILDRATTGLPQMDISAISAGRYDRIWMPLIPVFLESPLYGNGLASTFWAEPNLKARMVLIGHPHSAYLATLLDFGLIGAGIIGALFYTVWKRFRYLSKTHTDDLWRGYFEGASVALLVLMVQGLTDDRFIPSYTQAFLWIAIGLSWGTGSALPRSSPQKA